MKLVEYCIQYGAVAVGVAIFFAWQLWYPNEFKAHSVRWLLLLGLAGSAAIIILSNLLYRCPRCHVSFRKLKLEAMRLHGIRTMDLYGEACPRCHVSFDEPWK